MRCFTLLALLAALSSPLTAETGAIRVELYDAVTLAGLNASSGSAIDDGSQFSFDLVRVSTSWVFYDDSVTVTAGPGTGYWFTAYGPDYIPQTVTDAQIYNASTTKYKLYLARPVLSLSLSPTSISEGSTSTGTVTLRNSAGTAVTLRNSVTVTLASGTTARATVPSSVTIPASSSSATFTVSAVNNTIADGNASVAITATSGAWGNVSATCTVIDND